MRCLPIGHCRRQPANVRTLNVTRLPYESARLAQDMAGGLLVTLPSERDLAHPQLAGVLAKYLQGVEGCRTEDRCRMLRLVENLTIGPGAVGYLTESLHGAGSPQAQRIMLVRLSDFGGKVRLARRLAGVGDEGSEGIEGGGFVRVRQT